ncbi:MAG TPA: ABC transporter permease [Thermoplasmata archaeon]|nr:ABC transporter permease [Thermoplasmata archaeon]
MNVGRALAYFPTFARICLRSRLGVFMTLVFPVVLILLFGAIFSNTGSSRVPLSVENLDHDSVMSQQFLAGLNATGVVAVTLVSPAVGNLSDYVAHNGLVAGLVIPEGFSSALLNGSSVHLMLFTDPSSGAASAEVQGAVQGVANGMNLHLAGGSPLVTSINVNAGSHLFTNIDYLVPGLIGFSVLVSPMMQMVNLSSTWKREKLFRELSLTPLTRGEWLFATLLWYVVLALVSTLLLTGLGTVLFGAHVTLTVLALPYLLAGPVLFVSMGLLAGTVSKTPEVAAMIGNLITFPMMFLSGTFYPVSMFPSSLVPVAHALPLYYLINGLNAALLFGNPSTALTDLVIVTVLAIGFALAATQAFYWREERRQLLARGPSLHDGSSHAPAS